MTWLDKLIELLCELLKVLDGDCAELEGDSSDPETVIDAIEESYNPNNPPQPSGNSQQGEWCLLFSDIEAHLDRPENSLSQVYDAKLRGIVDGLQAAVGCP